MGYTATSHKCTGVSGPSPSLQLPMGTPPPPGSHIFVYIWHMYIYIWYIYIYGIYIYAYIYGLYIVCIYIYMLYIYIYIYSKNVYICICIYTYGSQLGRLPGLRPPTRQRLWPTTPGATGGRRVTTIVFLPLHFWRTPFAEVCLLNFHLLKLEVETTKSLPCAERNTFC